MIARRPLHSTKRGPGRVHKDGVPHGAVMRTVPPRVEQHTNPRRNAERKALKELGARQSRILAKAFRRGLSAVGAA